MVIHVPGCVFHGFHLVDGNLAGEWQPFRVGDLTNDCRDRIDGSRHDFWVHIGEVVMLAVQ